MRSLSTETSLYRERRRLTCSACSNEFLQLIRLHPDELFHPLITPDLWCDKKDKNDNREPARLSSPGGRDKIDFDKIDFDKIDSCATRDNMQTKAYVKKFSTQLHRASGDPQKDVTIILAPEKKRMSEQAVIKRPGGDKRDKKDS